MRACPRRRGLTAPSGFPRRRSWPTDFRRASRAWYTGPEGAIISMMSRLPPYAPTGSPPPITFPSVVRSGADSVERLGSAKAHAKTGHHLVKYQERSFVRGQLPGALEESIPREDHSHVSRHRLHNHRRYFSAVGREQALERIKVIGRARERVRRGCPRHPLANPGAQELPRRTPPARGACPRGHGSCPRTSPPCPAG